MALLQKKQAVEEVASDKGPKFEKPDNGTPANVFLPDQF
jgi:hypothetical protein